MYNRTQTKRFAIEKQENYHMVSKKKTFTKPISFVWPTKRFVDVQNSSRLSKFFLLIYIIAKLCFPCIFSFYCKRNLTRDRARKLLDQQNSWKNNIYH